MNTAGLTVGFLLCASWGVRWMGIAMGRSDRSGLPFLGLSLAGLFAATMIWRAIP